MWEKKNGPEPMLPGINMTHDQLFFLNFAQIWCGNMRDKAALEKIRTSVHSPGPVRYLAFCCYTHLDTCILQAFADDKIGVNK